MKKDLIFLGIETSCDETAAAVIKKTKAGKGKNFIQHSFQPRKNSQKFGGVVPELAARTHAEKIDHIIKKAISKANALLTNSMELLQLQVQVY